MPSDRKPSLILPVVVAVAIAITALIACGKYREKQHYIEAARQAKETAGMKAEGAKE